METRVRSLARAMLVLVDKVIIGVYLGVVVATGLWFARRARGSEEFFLAGRTLIWPLIGLSLFATNISTEHFVGLAAGGHSVGLVQGGYEWIASYCLLMLALVFAPQYLKHRVFTIPEYFEKRFGIEARLGLTVYFLAMIVLTKVAVAVYAGGTVIREITGWDLYAVMWGIGIVTALYTLAGGLAAVVFTDAIQAIVLIAGSVIMTVLALDAAGGWGELTRRLAEAGKADHLSMVRGPSDPDLPFTGFLLGNFLFGGMFYWCMDQVNVQRVLGARDVTQARRGAIFAGFLKIIPVFILVLPGVIAAVLYQDQIGEEHNRTYAVLVQNLLGPGLRGLVLAALLAALMSSLSSTFNSAATLVARDLVARFRPGTTTAAQIRIGQIALVAVMAVGILAAPLAGSRKTLWDYLQEVTAYLSVPFAVVGLGGVLWRRVNRPGAAAAVIVGVLAGGFLYGDTLYSRFSEGAPHLVGILSHPYLASFLHRSFLAAVLSAAALAGVSLLTAPPRADVLEGAFSLRRERHAGATPRPHATGDLLWAVLLFAVVTALWVVFR